MRLSISNIAWETTEDVAVAKLLRKFCIDAIDIAPSKYFPDIVSTKDEDVIKVRKWWADQGIEIIGMQSLLFGTAGLNLFGGETSQQAILSHLRSVCRIGACLGANRLVFGSPKNRDRTGLTETQADEQAVIFFKRLGNIAQEYGVIICLEPNPTQYGANFMTNSEEAGRVVKAVGDNSIRMQFDTGAVNINKELPLDVLECYSKLIGHVHASEPDLLPLGDGGTDHKMMYRALSKYIPDQVVTIEMIATKREPHLNSIKRALQLAVESYRIQNEATK